jgi:hypothetical protein
MPQGLYVQTIDVHRKQSAFFDRLAGQRHRRATALAQRALAAQKQGRPVTARRLMRQALNLKALAGRARLRSQNHRARVAELRRRSEEFWLDSAEVAVFGIHFEDARDRPVCSGS